MTREIIALALEAEGFKGGSQGFQVSEDREATCYVSTPGDVLTIGKVVRFDLRDKCLLLQTGREERFYFAYEDVLGLRFSVVAQNKERAPGFGR